MSRARIQAAFPRLKRTPYALTSPETPNYNCIAWAAGRSDRWWWPTPANTNYWPPLIPRKLELDSFRALFESLGYESCADGELEEGFEKVAVFTDDDGAPTHAARQLATGSWTSKLGPHEDISHLLFALEAAEYGDAALFLRRRR